MSTPCIACQSPVACWCSRATVRAARKAAKSPPAADRGISEREFVRAILGDLEAVRHG